MTFEQLLYADTLAHCASLQAAADRLHITKPALSIAISSLEEELGVRIFRRTNKGTAITPEGLQLLAAVSDVLLARNRLLQTASDISSSKTLSRVSLRYTATLLMPFVEGYLDTYQQEYPDVILDIQKSSRKQIFEDVRNHTIDAGFTVMPVMLSDLGEELTFTKLFTARTVMVCSENNVILKKDEITEDDLRAQKYCLFNDETNEYVFNQLQYRCGPLNVIFRTDDAWAMKKVIEAKNAVCLGRIDEAAFAWEKTVFEGLHFVSIDHLADVHCTLGWVTNHQYEMAEHTKRLLDIISETIKKDTGA